MQVFPSANFKTKHLNVFLTVFVVWGGYFKPLDFAETNTELGNILVDQKWDFGKIFAITLWPALGIILPLLPPCINSLRHYQRQYMTSLKAMAIILFEPNMTCMSRKEVSSSLLLGLLYFLRIYNVKLSILMPERQTVWGKHSCNWKGSLYAISDIGQCASYFCMGLFCLRQRWPNCWAVGLYCLRCSLQ